MITNFCDFCQISAKKWRFSQKTIAMIFFAKISSSLSKKTPTFSPIFRRKYFKNHDICPRLGEFSPIGLLLTLDSS
jgi:hypothetical protein